MKYRVHLFVSVRVHIEVEAESAQEALQRAEEAFDPCMIKDGEYADEMLAPACVDPLLSDGDVDYDNSVWIPDTSNPVLKTAEPLGPNMFVGRGWSVKVGDLGDYLYVKRLGRPGDIHIKEEDEGIVMDVWNASQDAPECINSMMISYSDLTVNDE